MSSFSIDTDKVSEVANDISHLSSTSSSIVNSVEDYNITNEDGFDFSGAKSAIENNVDGMKTKVNNTYILLDAVVNTHSSLQDSVGENNSSSPGANYGDYSYTGGNSGGGSSSSNYSSGGYGDTIPVAELTANQNFVNNMLSDANSGAPINSFPGLNISDPNALAAIDTALKENPSAYEKLLEELGKVKSTISNAESTLNEELEIVLSSNSIKSTTAEGVIAESFGKALIVVEASSKTPGIIEYTKEVNEVSKEHKIEFRFLQLDDIIDYSSTTSYNENITSEVLTIKKENQKDIKEIKEEPNNIETNEEQKNIEIEKTSSITNNIESNKANEVEEKVDEIEQNIDENKKEEEKEIIEDEASKNTESPEQEKIINEDEIELEEQRNKEIELQERRQKLINELKKSKNSSSYLNPLNQTKDINIEEKKEEKKEEQKTTTINSSKIKDQTKFDKLTNIPTKDGIKNDILNSPVTMIIKNNLIINAEAGILSRDRIEILISTSGISNK